MSVFQRLVLAVILIEIPIQLDIYLDYHQAEDASGAIGGWNISITTFCLVLLYATWLPSIAIRHARPSRSLLRAILPALAYLLAVSFSVLVAYQLKLSLFELFSLFQAFALFLFLACRVRGERDVLFVVSMLLLGLAMESLIMLSLRGVGHSITVFSIKARIDPNLRVGGTIGSPNGAATYLTMMLPLALGLLLCRLRTEFRVLALVSFALGTVALALTQSRGGWVSAGLAISLVCFFAWQRGRLSPLVPLAIAASGLIVCLSFADVIAGRLSADDKGSAYARLPLMEVASLMIKDHPLCGVGVNNMAVAMKPYVETANFRGGFIHVVHNRYLQVYAETGVFGLAAFLLFLLGTVRLGWRGWTWDDPRISPIALGIAAGVAGLMLRITVDTFSARALVQTLWVLAGLATAIALSRRDAPQHQASNVNPYSELR